MAGSARIGTLELQRRDWQHCAAAKACAVAAGALGARLYVRDGARRRGRTGDPARRRRRLGRVRARHPPASSLWTSGGEAAMLYRHAAPGAAVPGHGHRRDGECPDARRRSLPRRPAAARYGDPSSSAPAGAARYAGVDTDTGVVLYAHGDLDLDVRPG